jgi:WD40 repeat protein
MGPYPFRNRTKRTRTRTRPSSGFTTIAPRLELGRGFATVGRIRGPANIASSARRTAGLIVLLSCAVSLSADRGLSASTTAAIVVERGGDLYAISSDGSRTVRLTKTRIEEAQPAVSHDGSRIAFARGYWREGGISTVNVDVMLSEFARARTSGQLPQHWPAARPFGPSSFHVSAADECPPREGA